MHLKNCKDPCNNVGVHCEWVIAEGASRGIGLHFEYSKPTSIVYKKWKFNS